MKFPKIRENYSFAVEDYFHDVADKINELIELNQGGVAVFCISGFSRSATMVLAYAIKHLRLTLKDAFHQLQKARPYARPNLIFMEKLIAFEATCHGLASISMKTLSINLNEADNTTNESNDDDLADQNDLVVHVKVPGFYKKDYPHLHTLEVNEAHRSWETLQRDYEQPPRESRPKESKADTSSTDEATNELKPFIVEATDYRRFVKEVARARQGKTSPVLIQPKEKPKSGSKVKVATSTTTTATATAPETKNRKLEGNKKSKTKKLKNVDKKSSLGGKGTTRSLKTNKTKTRSSLQNKMEKTKRIVVKESKTNLKQVAKKNNQTECASAASGASSSSSNNNTSNLISTTSESKVMDTAKKMKMKKKKKAATAPGMEPTSLSVSKLSSTAQSIFSVTKMSTTTNTADGKSCTSQSKL